MLRIPENVFRYSGNATPIATSAIFGVSPMPIQTMNSGISPKWGSVRSICIGGSTASSPMRLRPATTARATPIAAPTAKPSPTRWTETSVAAPSVPSATRSRAVARICSGAAIFCSGITPAELSSCQTTRITAGLTQRRSQPRRTPRPLVTVVGGRVRPAARLGRDGRRLGRCECAHGTQPCGRLGY